MSNTSELVPEGRGDGPTEPVVPEVIVVPYRPARGAWKLLPPLLIVLLGAGFLAYRSRSADWRGISALFERRPRPAAAPVQPPAAGPELALAPEPQPTPPAEPEPPAAKVGVPAAKETPKTPPAAEKPAEPKVDPLDDIRREAEKTKQKLAELERLKEREAQKLDRTAPQRERADRLARRNNIDRRILAMQQLLERQMAEFQRHAMESMAEMEREFMGGGVRRGAPMPRGFDGMAELQRRFFNGGMPGPFGMMPMPGFGPPPGNGRAVPRGNNNARERVWRGPNGATGRIREFQGPDGIHGFEMRWQGPGAGFVPPPEDNDDEPPPPPVPQARPGKRID